jgi:6-phosphogluconate dehydrogenase
VDIGMVGLGRMGAGLTRRLLKSGHRVVAFDRSPETIEAVAADGAEPAATLEQLRDKLEPPRTVWVMVPSGAPTQEAIDRLAELLDPGDVLIDGGNSHFRDSVARARALAAKRIAFLDVGTSGGVWGLKEGFCLMVGGPEHAFAQAEPAFRTLAPEGGHAHVGPSGAGHYVKMVHNGIEYGLLQAYAEGFEILHASDYDLDLHQVAELWRHGSVVRSWLLDLIASAYAKDPELAGFSGWVEDSGEGRWTVQEALEKDVPAPVINLSLIMRLRSRVEDSYAGRLISALRNEFGGHPVHTNEFGGHPAHRTEVPR